MLRRGVVLSLVVFVCHAVAAHPQGLAIDHTAVGCIVVGKYPKMNACFTPAADLARSRVYFRPEGMTELVLRRNEGGSALLGRHPARPGKKLVGKKIEYYVEAQDKTFDPARTAEYAPIVVQVGAGVQEGRARRARSSTTRPWPCSRPCPPASWAAGSAPRPSSASWRAGAAAAGTAAVVASNDDDTTTTTVAVVVNPTTTTTLATSSTTTTTLPPTGNKPPFAVLTTNPDPPSGQGPLTVTFDLCKSTDPEEISRSASSSTSATAARARAPAS